MTRGQVRSKAGKREFGVYVRSRWEANYYRYLQLLKDRGDILEFGYEPERFMFTSIQRGTRSYLPDFRVEWADGRVEYHEVKGYWTSQARTAVKRFAKFYPQHTLVIIEKAQYDEFTVEYKDQIPEWED